MSVLTVGRDRRTRLNHGTCNVDGLPRLRDAY